MRWQNQYAVYQKITMEFVRIYGEVVAVTDVVCYVLIEIVIPAVNMLAK